MRNYEVTFVVDPVLSRDEINSTAKKYVDYLKDKDGNIVHVDEMGLRELAYPINKKNSGYYYSVEFESNTGEMIPEMELDMRRDSSILRFLSVKLDKYGVKYNADKRAGLIGKSRPVPANPEAAKGDENTDNKKSAPRKDKPAPKAAAAKPATKTAEKPVEKKAKSKAEEEE